jgi:hypothetical protein
MFNRQIIAVATLFSCCIPAFGDVSATQAYVELHKKELAATCYDDLLPLHAKASIAKNKMSKKEMDEMFPFLKSMMPIKVKVVSETVTGDSATLKLTATPNEPLKKGDSETTEGTVTLLREDGQWLLDNEKWQSKMELH